MNAEPEQLEAVLPLAKRYGAALLCLPLGKKELPETAEERVSLAKEIVLEAYNYGLRPNDLLLDPLVLTLASSQHAAREHKNIKTLCRNFWIPNSDGFI